MNNVYDLSTCGPQRDRIELRAVELRTRVTKGADSKKAAPAMAYKLLYAAQQRWRRFSGRELVADVLAGVKFQGRHQDHRRGHAMTDERVAA